MAPREAGPPGPTPRRAHRQGAPRGPCGGDKGKRCLTVGQARLRERRHASGPPSANSGPASREQPPPRTQPCPAAPHPPSRTAGHRGGRGGQALGTGPSAEAAPCSTRAHFPLPSCQPGLQEVRQSKARRKAMAVATPHHAATRPTCRWPRKAATRAALPAGSAASCAPSSSTGSSPGCGAKGGGVGASRGGRRERGAAVGRR